MPWSCSWSLFSKIKTFLKWNSYQLASTAQGLASSWQQAISTNFCSFTRLKTKPSQLLSPAQRDQRTTKGHAYIGKQNVKCPKAQKGFPANYVDKCNDKRQHTEEEVKRIGAVGKGYHLWYCQRSYCSRCVSPEKKTFPKKTWP